MNTERLSNQPVHNQIGILTGGGDCPGLNAVIRAVVLSAAKRGVKCIGFLDGFEGLYNLVTVDLECDDVCGLLAVGGTILGTTNAGHYARIPLEEDVVKRSKENFDKLKLDCVVCIGGDGTMSIAHHLSTFGIPIVGVPKTIDNDLRYTDQTFGFDSAVQIVTESLDRLHTTAASHHRILVVEVMGRNSGFIALHSGVAGRATAILIPEIEWNWNSLASQISKKARKCELERRDKKQIYGNYSIIVVAEGAKIPQEGQKVIEGKRLGGIGQVVGETLGQMVGMETRVVVLGHVQRGGSPSSFDRILSTKFGSMAGLLAATGDYGKMVALKGQNIVTVDVTGDVQLQRKVEADDQLLLTARDTGIIFGDE